MNWHRIDFDEIDSTNSYARRLVLAGSVTGKTLITAHSQSAGRGCGDKLWLSKAGASLLFSLVIPKPQNPFEEIMRCSVAALETFKRNNLTVFVKWPNDLLTPSRKKIAGILAEGVEEHLIVGMGINLLQTKNDFPDSLQKSAASYYTETHKSINPDHFLETVLMNFDGLTIEKAHHIYQDHLALLNEPVWLNDEPLILKGVGRDGRVLAETALGELKHFTTGTLRWNA